MDSVGLGQSFKEECEKFRCVDCGVEFIPYQTDESDGGYINRVCPNCYLISETQQEKCWNCKKLKAEIDALERRNEELEDELQGIKDDPSVLMEDWSGDLD